MDRSRFVLRVGLPAVLLWVVAQSVGCGAMSSNSNRVLQSITVTPASADAQSFTLGQVQFIATGTFSKPPSPALVPFASPYTGSWTVSNTSIATISQGGLAQCVAGAAGTVTVNAIASSNSATGMGQMSTAVQGTARLSCP